MLIIYGFQSAVYDFFAFERKKVKFMPQNA